MSWDIFVQDLPASAERVGDIPDDFRPRPVGRRSQIIERIIEIIPAADFSDPSWGRIDGEDWSIEISMGAQEECRGFAFHVRGGDAAADAVSAILRRLNLRALDSQTGEFFVANESSAESFRDWKKYRDEVLGG
jgi:hypothetical protein